MVYEFSCIKIEPVFQILLEHITGISVGLSEQLLNTQLLPVSISLRILLLQLVTLTCTYSHKFPISSKRVSSGIVSYFWEKNYIGPVPTSPKSISYN